MVRASAADLLRRRQAAIPRGPFNIAPVFVERARGAKLWTTDGSELIDFCGGLGVANVGHNHPRVVEAVRSQADRCLHTCFHVSMYEPYIRLAERLNEIAPISATCQTALFNSGAEAVENAVKISRAYTRRSAVLAFERGFHGRTLLGMSLTGKTRPYCAGYGPFAPEVYRLPFEPFFSDPAELSDEQVLRRGRQALQRLAAFHVEPENVACLIVEPVLGEGGFFPIRGPALELLRQFCTDSGIVLACDEVQSGFGRCGAMFACQRYGVEPDLVTMGKSLAGGMVLSAVTGREEMMNAPDVGGLGGTYGGNPVACAAALAVLEIMADEDLPRRALEIGAQVMARFQEFQRQFRFISGAHGLGAMCALVVSREGSSDPDPNRAAKICREALARGLLLMTASGNVIRTLMPLTIDDQTLGEGLDIIAAALAEAG